MSLEDICSVEALLCCTAASWAKATYHGAFVVGQGMSVLVVSSSKSLDVVLARWDGALLRPCLLVCEHVCLEVLELLATRWDWTYSLVGIV